MKGSVLEMMSNNRQPLLVVLARTQKFVSFPVNRAAAGFASTNLEFLFLASQQTHGYGVLLYLLNVDPLTVSPWRSVLT